MTYWHFREHLEQCKISIVVEPTKDQIIIDLLIIPIAAMEFEKLKTNIMGPTRNTVKRSETRWDPEPRLKLKMARLYQSEFAR